MPDDLALLNTFQRDFPLTSRPFQNIADVCGGTEDGVLERLRTLHTTGVISRIGAVFAVHRLGVSTLAALAVPPDQLDDVAERVNAYPEVNHNYEREHRFNLWAVLTAATPARLQAIMDAWQHWGFPLLNLPLKEAFHVDLGFDLRNGARLSNVVDASATPAQPEPLRTLWVPNTADQSLLAMLQSGIPFVARPYTALADSLGLTEQTVLERVAFWRQEGLIKRWGIIVQHRALGYTANAMVVWDIPDAAVSGIGHALATESGVNLCYRRDRQPPDWPFNLFCMLHSRCREDVLERIAQLRAAHALSAYPYAALFSGRCFKQRGAYYWPLG